MINRNVVSNELVSIITPSYNSQAYISQTIESIQAQTYSHWELLITDDCSTDQTIDIIKGYQKGDSRIKLFLLHKNQGAGVARNNSIKEANNYLKFIVKKEPDNILAWHLKGISHNRLGEPIYANLSAAEEFLRKRDYKNAKFFAEKVVSASKKFSSENLRASDIINLINEI